MPPPFPRIVTARKPRPTRPPRPAPISCIVYSPSRRSKTVTDLRLPSHSTPGIAARSLDRSWRSRQKSRNIRTRTSVGQSEASVCYRARDALAGLVRTEQIIGQQDRFLGGRQPGIADGPALQGGAFL